MALSKMHPEAVAGIADRLAACWLCILVLLLLAGCAAYDGRGLQPGVATVDDVIAVMGEPVLRWQDADGSLQLAYPRGPAGPHTYMAFFAPDGRLIRIENVLQMSHFSRIVPGRDDHEAILRLLGPPNPAWTIYFAARDELAWEWRFCDDWSRLARFDVLFDATSGLVRSTMQRPEPSGYRGGAPYCGRSS
ncbi:hypothetical protein [Azonexus sp.]|uniref:hypothetical protein n=1 Tax=Azonexus sp. TaxID=1872668 RepID=UPI002819C959|nr:hypothetical protein [Azonexus sp.]MDR1996014.1 hypothetical protein [Azonexus sp.]